MISPADEKLEELIDHYFVRECNINMTIRDAFGKGFKLGAKKVKVAARKKGHWVAVENCVTPGDDPYWVCSECGKGGHVYGVENCNIDKRISENQWKACPNCEIEMRNEWRKV